MLTIFSCPKPFTDPHISVIQRNAIKSWTLLEPRPEIILIGDEKGVAEVCKEFGLRHIPEVERNKYGTPLLNSIFQKAEHVATNEIMCYVNADIILMQDFMDAIIRVYKHYLNSNFLCIGRRFDVDIKEEINFNDKNWRNKLINLVKLKGKLHPATGLDYFVFFKGLYKNNIPPFAIGRGAWDNWLIYYACKSNAVVIDVSDCVLVIHQNHDYSHYPGGIGALLKSEEAKQNLKLAGGWRRQYNINDAKYILTKDGIKRAPIFKHLKERFKYFFIVPIRKNIKKFLWRTLY